MAFLKGKYFVSEDEKVTKCDTRLNKQERLSKMNVFDNFQDITRSSEIYNTKKNSDKSIKKSTSKYEYKPDILDFFSEKVVNKNDIVDMVTTPRAIFKGYLCFTAGTLVNTIGGLIKQEKISNFLKITGCLASIYGTYNFVKPFLIREEKLTNFKK